VSDGADLTTVLVSVGWALVSAGTHLGRISHFRQKALGHAPDALSANRTAMQQDLATAAFLLHSAQCFLEASRVRRRSRRRKLRRRLDEIEALGAEGQALATPLNYSVALQQLEAGPRRPA
jgi:hypothetical protein